IVFGLIPALRSTRLDLNPSLKGGIFWRSTQRAGLNRVAVAVQIALCMILLIGAGLLVRTLHNLRVIDVGFDKDGVTVFAVDRFLETNQYAPLLARIESFPGVRSATAWKSGLLGSSFMQVGPIYVEGYIPRSEDDLYSYTTQVGPRFFETLGIALRS